MRKSALADYRRLGTFVPGLFCMLGESMGTVLFDSLNDVMRVMRLTYCEYGIFLLSFNQMIRGFL